MSTPKEDLEAKIRRAQDDFEVLSNLREKLEILTEHVSSRKEALDEEIEESINEAILNARDSLERVQENIEPKLDKWIQERLDLIQKRMDRLKDENQQAVIEELRKQSERFSQEAAAGLDERVGEKVRDAKKSMEQEMSDQIRKELESALAQQKSQMENTLGLVRLAAFAALGLGLVALGVAFFR